MKKAALSAVWGLSAILAPFGTAFAQEGNAPNVAFIEIYGCNYNAGNDMDDVMAVTRRWTAWADQRNVTDYGAQILTPYYYSDAYPYDFIWLGFYLGAEAMGAGEAQWLAEGGDIQEAFDEVTSCGIHAQFAGIATNIPEQPAEESDAVGLVSFQNCSLENAHTIQEAIQAHRTWGDYLAEKGSDLFMAALIPIAGENPAADYDYKAITGYSSGVAYGKALAALGGGGLQRAGQIFGRTVDCDTQRIYTTRVVRQMQNDN